MSIFGVILVHIFPHSGWMMMMNCFCGMVDQRKAFSLISSRDHCHRSSPSWISDTPLAGSEPAQNLSSGLNEWSCAVVITTTPRRHNYSVSLRVRPKCWKMWTRKIPNTEIFTQWVSRRLILFHGKLTIKLSFYCEYCEKRGKKFKILKS